MISDHTALTTKVRVHTSPGPFCLRSLQGRTSALTDVVYLLERSQGVLLVSAKGGIQPTGRTQRLALSHWGALCLILPHFGNNGEEGELGG